MLSILCCFRNWMLAIQNSEADMCVCISFLDTSLPLCDLLYCFLCIIIFLFCCAYVGWIKADCYRLSCCFHKLQSLNYMSVCTWSSFFFFLYIMSLLLRSPVCSGTRPDCWCRRLCLCDLQASCHWGKASWETPPQVHRPQYLYILVKWLGVITTNKWDHIETNRTTLISVFDNALFYVFFFHFKFICHPLLWENLKTWFNFVL